MTTIPPVNPVYVGLNRPLTIGGADRRLFFLALVMGGTTFTFFNHLLAGVLMFVVLYLAARWMTQTDPQLLRIILRSAAFRSAYDPGMLDYVDVRRGATR
jgi:type IV secretory pathway TrbD component